MPEGDVTPADTIRARPAECFSRHRSYMALPKNPVRPAPSGHVDPKEFSEVDQSPYIGVGDIRGTKDALKVTTQGEPAVKKPMDGQAYLPLCR